MKPIDDRKAHAGILLPNALQAPGRTDIDTFHAEITGNFFRFNEGSSGMYSAPDIEHDN
jgi:hypothetical protein